MEKNVKISCSPFNSNLEVVGDMVMKLGLPYSKDQISIQFNPNIQGYQENLDKGDVKIRQMTFSTPTDQTQDVTFDFQENNSKSIKIDDTTYSVRLMSTGKENLEGQDFLYFDFFVTW